MSVKEMLAALNADLENVKMVHSILMNFANNIRKVVKQTARHVFQPYQLVTHIKVLPQLVLDLLVLMDIAKEPVQQLKLLAYPKFVMKLQIQQQLMRLVINIKLDVLL